MLRLQPEPAMPEAMPPVLFRIVPRVFAVRPRLSIAIVTGILAWAACVVAAPQLRPSTDLILGWDALAVTFMATMLQSMVRHGPDQIRARAAAEDQGRAAILTLIILGVAVSIGAVGAELSLAHGSRGGWQGAHIALAFGTVVASWMMMQLIFAVHYAHEYYDADEAQAGQDAGGLLFPGGEPPDYWDFLHFSIIIGVASQTADVAFTSKGLRRLGTVHSLVAFAFNTVIVALTINLLAGLF
jgi:uncharacterized membrane protein